MVAAAGPDGCGHEGLGAWPGGRSRPSHRTAASGPCRCTAATSAGRWTSGSRTADAARGRWDEAVEGFIAARESADRLRARPWSIAARAGLADALIQRGGLRGRRVSRGAVARDRASTRPRSVFATWSSGRGADRPVHRRRTRRRRTLSHRRRLSHRRMRRSSRTTTRCEFRREGAVWRLAYGGRIVHMPDAKGLEDLHLLLSQPGAAIAAERAAGPGGRPRARRRAPDGRRPDARRRGQGSVPAAPDRTGRRDRPGGRARRRRPRHGHGRGAAGVA